MHTIVVTGGHHNSALVVAKEFVSRGVKVAWIGHRKSSRGDTVDSAEYLEVKSAGIPFFDLRASRLILDLREIMLFPFGVLSALKYLKKIRPVAILSFGGYLGGTVAIAAKLLGIKIYLHEQTVIAGMANKLIGRLASKIYLTWESSLKYFSPAKAIVVGLPLRQGILTGKKAALFSRRKPVLLVMGGKQGAHAVNQFIFDHLIDLLAHYNVVHQTGTSSITQDYDFALSLKNTLGSLADCYLPLGYITESEIGRYLHSSSLYLGRSGAHICYELGILGLPSILVPLMSTHDQEQLKNARILQKGGVAVILSQQELTIKQFFSKTQELGSRPKRPLALPLNATAALVDDLESQLK